MRSFLSSGLILLMLMAVALPSQISFFSRLTLWSVLKQSLLRSLKALSRFVSYIGHCFGLCISFLWSAYWLVTILQKIPLNGRSGTRRRCFLSEMN